MMIENIEKIRKDVIIEIEKKVKKNPKYFRPCNKERQEDMKNPADIDIKRNKRIIESAGCLTESEYRDKCSQNKGFKDYNEDRREWRHETGRHLPKEFNEDCSSWFGEFISQNYVMKTFEDPVKTPPGNPGFDWKCEKIDHKGACLIFPPGKSPNWLFNIKYNNIADWFILSAWDDRNSLNPLHIWAFHKDDIIRGRKFWERQSFSVIDSGLKSLEKYEVTNRLDKLKELCNGKNNI